ncbi:MAG: hypothetical protein AB2693_31750 [Candidatus Thiodiazotropha sp.]
MSVNAKNGTGTLLTVEEERKLVQHISYMADIGYGYNKSSIQYMARDYAVSLGKDVQASDSLSNCWFYGFMQRWPELKIAKPQKLALLRAKATSREVLNQYYTELGTILTSNNLINKPERIYNIDETGISTEHSPPKIVCSKDTNPQSVTSPRGSTITVIASGNALGNSIPPYYVFQGQRWNDDLLHGSCPGADGEMSKNGWSTAEVFRNYITKHFKKYSNVSSGSAAEPTLVLYDGHRSHISLTLTEWARTNHVILFVLPPHTSHLTQPLDVGVFGPFKTMYSRECQVYLKNHPGIAITKYEVAELTSRPYVKALSAENLISAFRKTGIYPFDRSTITESQVAPSTIYANQKKADTEDTTSHPEPEPMPAEPINLTTEQGHVNSTPELSTPDNTEQPVKVTSESIPSEFFKERTITTAIVKKPKRKFVPPFIAGNLLKKSVTDILSEQSSAKIAKQTVSLSKTKTSTSKKSAGTTKGQKTLKQKKQSKQDKQLKLSTEPVPSTSGLNTGGAPLNLDTPRETSDSESEGEDEKCCVCGDWQPEEIRGCNSIVFVKWAKCDYCSHWTHLQFCTNVRVLRLGSEFRCPHCPVQNS